MADVIVALDFPSRGEALAMADRLGDAVGFYKVGLELHTRAGPDVVRELRARQKRVFLDLKLHDIPNTVAAAVRAAAELEVDLLTVHTTGGAEMLRAAAAAAENRLALLGVTLLTSLSPTDVEGAWARPISSLREEVVRLATLARDCGLPGVVTSPQEAEAVRRRLGPDLVIVTPGIRMAGGDAHDQSRIATPGAAARAGATYLVIGRPVTAARDPVAAIASVRAELDVVGV
jgi:orotidine-5'-phosphate decarboxylase